MEQFSQELGDRAPLSSLTRMVRLWQQSGLTEPVFVQELIYPNRSKVRQTPNVKNRMAYFFSLIEDRLGLRPHLPPDG